MAGVISSAHSRNPVISLPVGSFVTLRQVLIYPIHFSALKESSSHEEESCQHLPLNNLDRKAGFLPAELLSSNIQQ